MIQRATNASPLASQRSCRAAALGVAAAIAIALTGAFQPVVAQSPGTQKPNAAAPAAKAPTQQSDQKNVQAPTTAPQQLLRSRTSRAKRRLHRSATTQVHSAWLTEIIDLDRTGAIEKYDDILKQNSGKQPEKWIAVSRLRELGRIGVLRPEPLATPNKAPSEVRKALKLLEEPFPFRDVLNEPGTTQELPPLRPATPLVQDWVRDQIGPTVEERYRRPRGRPTRRVPTPEWRPYGARDIIKLEIEGNRTRANALRGLYFIDFQPMKVSGSREKLLKQAMERLAKVIEEERWPRARNDLRTFEKHLQTLAANQSSPQAGAYEAIELIRRIPYYSEQLLAPEKAPGKPK